MAARLIVGAKKYDHITPVLYNLHWLPDAERIKFKLLLLTFKGLDGMAPDYLSDILVKTRHTRCLCSNTSLTLQVPKSKYKTFGDRAFCVSAPRLWNSLPSYLRDIHELETFKRGLKTLLFTTHLTPYN